MKIDTLRSGGQSQGGLDASGGTLTGPLMLSRDPQVPMEAATKRYVDNCTQALNASNIVSGTLPIARLPAFSGDVTSEAGQNTMNLSNTGVTAGEYGKIVVDAKGRVTNGTGVGNTDIPNISFNKITTGKPTTLAGYGITDAVNAAGGLMTGDLILSGNPVSGEHMVPKQYVDGMTNSLSAAKTGDIVRKAYSSTPAGFLKCNGAEVSKTTYSDLYAIIGDSYTSFSFIGNGTPWKKQYEFNTSQSQEIGPWTVSTSLPITLNRSSAIVTKNRVYLLGGYNGAAYTNTVYTAPINVDGTLSAWTTSASLPGPLSASHVVVVKNRVYMLGGHNGAITNIVYTAPINADGTLGAWTTGTSLPVNLAYSQAIVTNNRVYLLGGHNGAAFISTIYTAPINSDGSLGVWTTGTSLPTALLESQAIVTKNRVYLIGGEYLSGDVPETVIYTAPINSDGTLGTWTTGTSLPTALSESQAIVTKNRVYLIGGRSGFSTFTSTVYTAPINADGTLGTWTTAPILPGVLTSSQAIVTKNYIYMLGGFNGAVTNVVYSAPFSGGLNDYSVYFTEDTTNYMMPGSGRPWQQQYQINSTQSGDITGWTLAGNLPITLHTSQVLVTKNRVYLLGGSDSLTTWLSTVYTAPINADGTLGTWATTTSLPDLSSRASCVVAKNRVYLIGGAKSGSSQNTVFSAQINADGTLGTWNTFGNLPSGVSHSQAIVTKNRIYLLGGSSDSGSSAISAIYTTVINSDGTLGTWTSAGNLPVILGWSQAAVTKNRVYLIGGISTGNVATSSVYTAPINSDGILGTWSTASSLPAALRWSQVLVSNKYIYLIGGTDLSNTTNVVYTAPIAVDGSILSWTNATSLPFNISVHQIAILNNKLYIFGGSPTSATLTSEIYKTTIAEGSNDYSSYYDGTITPIEPVNPSTLFKLPDMSATDINGIYHYIKY